MRWSSHLANTLITPTQVAREVGYEFSNSIKGASYFDRSYDSKYRMAGAKVGDTIQIRRPQLWDVRSGQSYSAQNLLNRTVDLVLSKQRGVDFQASSAELTLDIDDFRERYVKTAGSRLANKFDEEAMASVYKKVFNSVGTLGTTTNTSLLWLQAGVKISDQAGDFDKRVAVLDPLAMVSIVNAERALRNPPSVHSEAYRRGEFATDTLAISRWAQDQNVPRFTSGNCGTSTPLVDGAGQTGSSIATDGWASRRNGSQRRRHRYLRGRQCRQSRVEGRYGPSPAVCSDCGRG